MESHWPALGFVCNRELFRVIGQPNSFVRGIAGSIGRQCLRCQPYSMRGRFRLFLPHVLIFLATLQSLVAQAENHRYRPSGGSIRANSSLTMQSPRAGELVKTQADSERSRHGTLLEPPFRLAERLPAYRRRDPYECPAEAAKIAWQDLPVKIEEILNRQHAADAITLCFVAEMMKRAGDYRAEQAYVAAITADPAEPVYELLFANYLRHSRGAKHALTFGP